MIDGTVIGFFRLWSGLKREIKECVNKIKGCRPKRVYLQSSTQTSKGIHVWVGTLYNISKIYKFLIIDGSIVDV